MKRLQEEPLVEIEPSLLDRLKHLLTGGVEPEGVYQILAFLEPAQLHYISKMRDMEGLRAFLSEPDTFRKLYEKRRADVPRSKLSYAEEDLVHFLNRRNMPINYWHVWLSVSAFRNYLFSREKAIQVLLNQDFHFLQPQKDPGIYRLTIKVNQEFLKDESKHLYFGPWARYSPEAREAILQCEIILGLIYGDIPRIPAPKFDGDNTIVLDTAINKIGDRHLIDVLDFSQRLFPINMLEYENKMDALQIMMDSDDPFTEHAHLTQSLLSIIEIYRKQFASVFTYLLLDRGYFLDAAFLGFDQSTTLIRNKAI